MKLSKNIIPLGLIIISSLWSCNKQGVEFLQQSNDEITQDNMAVTSEESTKEIAEIPHYLRKDNFTVFRVIVLNKENKILMARDNGHWGMPWVNFTKRQFQMEAIDSMAMEYGIKLSDVELRGQFSFMYDYKPTVTFRNFYVAHYDGVDLKIPTDAIETKFEKVEWIDIPTAIEKNGVTAIKQITKHILDNPETVWGGSFMVSHTDTDHPTKQVGGFFSLFSRAK